MASSGLVQALLGGGGYGVGHGVQDPATLRALQRTGLAQAMLQQGMESGPAYPMQALGRLGQTLAGSLMLERGMGDLDAIAKDRETGAQDANTFINGGGMAPSPSVPATPVQPQPMVQPAVSRGAMAADGLPPTPELMPVSSPGGAKVSVSKDAAPAFQGLLADLEAAGYPINPKTTGGYNRRMIAGTQTPSEHAFGNAVDVNWNDNPQGAGKPSTIPPELARQLAAKYGLTWGGDFKTNPDPMHFEYKPQGGGGVQYAQAGNVANDGTSPQRTPAGGSPAAGAYDSPEIKGALATIQRAQQVLADPRYRFNPAAQEAAKSAIEQAKLQLQLGTHIADRDQAANARTEERGYQRAQKQEDRAYTEAHKTPDRVTMLDPGGKGTGIYEVGPTGVGRRIGDAPKQPGESSGPFSGTGMDAQVNNVLLSIGPKIAGGTATQPERDQYSLAYQHMMNGQIMPVPDPTDPTGQRQVLARIPGAVPPQFPKPDFTPAQTPTQAPAQAPVAAPEAAPAPTAAAPPAGTQAPQSAAAGGQSAPQVIPGTTRATSDQKLTAEERQVAALSLRMTEASKVINDLESKGIHSGNTGSNLLSKLPGGNFVLTPEYQTYQQQAMDWARAKLRRESGAAIGDDEARKEVITYFPQPGDKPQVIAQKRRSREIADLGQEEGSGRARINPDKLPARNDGASSLPALPPGFEWVK